jgi:hypothetical protein
MIRRSRELCRSLRELGSIYDVNPQLALRAINMPPAIAGFCKYLKRSNDLLCGAVQLVKS